ncbi:tetratricopeptide repeat-containing diguanylate cyclase [Colwellia sp. KU-HH00111]|uniref:tetratricopeptide repeat-containing diguanylate cyclase n=1 Tax=Colwellia sp. KU-HH00111 TaxID=3127652 RepID=UPI003365A115
MFRNILLLFFFCSIFVVNAAQLTDAAALQKMEHQLHKQPWKTYQTLLIQAEQFDQMSANYKLWWLLRKAQAENLLYFFDRFNQTVAQATEAINEQTPDKIIININIFNGIILQRQGKYQQSQTVLKAALESAKDNNFTYLAVHAKQELAYTRSLTQIYELSLTELQQAYVEAFALNDIFLLAKINEVYGAIYGYMHDYAKSIEYYHKALTSYQQLEYPAHEVEAIYGLAATYRYWKKYDLAIEYYQRYQQAIKFSPNNIDGKFYAAYGIAMSEAEQGRCNRALVSLDHALALPGLIDYKAELYKRKAQCLIKLNKLAEAEQSLTQASDILAEIPELDGTHWQIEIIKIRAELAQAQGQSSHAYQLLKEFNKSEIAMLKKSSAAQLLRIRSVMEDERKNVEIALLQQRAKVQALQFQQQKQKNNMQAYIISIVALLVLFILLFAIFQWRNNRKLLALSIRDPLTNLFNRRYIFDFLNKLVNIQRSEKSTVSIILIDIDDFKQVNDLYGHHFGDAVICKIADIGKEIMRKEDIIGRVGGEEFLCVLPRLDAIQSLHIAQRFVNKVNACEFMVEDHQHKSHKVMVTISIGIATTGENIHSSTQLYVQADKALYHAKASGKNRAMQYHQSMKHAYQKETSAGNYAQDLEDKH